MRLINADGGEAEISGNGLRCLAALPRARAAPCRAAHVVHTGAGPRHGRWSRRLGGDALPRRHRPRRADPRQRRASPSPWSRRRRASSTTRSTSDGETVRVTATSLGNPHCAVFLDAPADDGLLAAGPRPRAPSLFPAADQRRVRDRRVAAASCASASGSAAWATRAPRARARPARPWPRSSTAAPTASCAWCATAARSTVDWPEGGTVRQTGEVEIVFEGEWVGPTA